MLFRQETLEVEGSEFILNVHHEDRRNARISVGQRNINVRLPASLDAQHKRQMERDLLEKAKQKLANPPRRKRYEPTHSYKDQDILRTVTKQYRLHIHETDTKRSNAQVYEDQIYLSISSHLSKDDCKWAISTLVSRVIASEHLPWVQEKLSELNRKHFDVPFNKVFLKNLRSRWGSCSSKGNTNISTRLLFAPQDVLEYVCIHELAHLIEPNHSPRFWKLVERAMPDYRAKMEWLQKEGPDHKL